MNRKSFLSATCTLAAGLSLPVSSVLAAPAGEEALVRRPPYLREGDTIGITAPAGAITAADIKPAADLLQSWGFRVRAGSTIGQKDFTFGGTDDQRLSDFQQMLDDPSINAIMCARGGYGSIRIVDRIDWTKFRAHPKWIIGFSDITVLHSHLHTQCRTASIHSKMTNSFPDDWATAEPIQVETINSIRDALTGKSMNYTASPNAQNRAGIAEGPLVGGNLKTLETLAGSASDIRTDGKILFVEDTGEYLYSIDRMFWSLERTGKLKALKALIVGGFKVKPDDPGDEFGRTVQDIVLEKVRAYKYPVCFDFPVGHQKANFALKCGLRHRLSVSAAEVRLTHIL